MRKNKMKFKILLTNISFLIFIIAICFLVAEFIVRSLFKEETVLFPRYHTDANYGQYKLRKIRPNSTFIHTSVDGKWEFNINNQGLRNNIDYGYKKTKGTIRIISLGDSHTQGYEARQNYTYSSIIEKYLNTHGYNAEVINAGISGFSTAEELLFLENEGIKYNPDFVVLGFYANDFEDNIKSNFFTLDKNGNLSIEKYEHIPGVKIQNFIYSFGLVRWLGENSYFYSLLFNNTWKFFKTKLSKNASDRAVEYAIPSQTDISNYQKELTSALIIRMYNFCKKNNIKLIIIDIPKITDGHLIQPSVPKSLIENMTKYSDGYISSTSLIADYAGVAEIHRPHGHRHISEFTHAIFGVSAAKEIISLSQ